MRACDYPDCERPHFARGYCNTHYQRFKRNGTADLLDRQKAACLADGCATGIYSNGLCIAHYHRLRKTGRLDLPSTVERLVAGYTVDTNGCWVFGTAGLNGYGRISIDNQQLLAHRVSWETFIGPIPEGLTIDHLCRVRACINPAHLEPVTRAENVRREMAARRPR